MIISLIINERILPKISFLKVLRYTTPRLCSMSHLRLHAGLCVLKLAGEPSCFDLIPLELFQEVAWLIQDPCPQVKQAMLNKLQVGNCLN